MVNWQLSKQGIRWPVSHNCIAGSILELNEVTYFLKITADQVLVKDRRLKYYYKLLKQAKKSKLRF